MLKLSEAWYTLLDSWVWKLAHGTLLNLECVDPPAPPPPKKKKSNPNPTPTPGLPNFMKARY